MLAVAAGDIALIVDSKGRIIDASGDEESFPMLGTWIGSEWLETVTVESRPKVSEMLAVKDKGKSLRWRQVNHIGPSGDVPVRYIIMGLGQSGRRVAIGREMSEAAGLQQRLLQAQQSLERDYQRLRQTETRHRLLFENVGEAVLIIDANDYRVREVNAAGITLLGQSRQDIVGRKLTGLVTAAGREVLIAYLGAVLSANALSPLKLHTAANERPVLLSGIGFRHQGSQNLMIRLNTESEELGGDALATLAILEGLPDAFVVADHEMKIVSANLAFVELVHAATADQLKGRALADYLGRPGIDLDLITTQLSKYGQARNVSTVLRLRESDEEEPVEVSAVVSDDSATHYGFSIRPTGRRMRDLPPSNDDLPRSVEQLTELVGRMSLKDIVRESTDLIERLCIEAALKYTSDNRASAAEILGLSRQSLYSKLHRYGLGNLGGDDD